MPGRTASRGWWITLLAGAIAVAVGVVLLVTARRLPPAFSAAPSAAATSSVVSPPSAAAVSPAPAATSPVPVAGPFRPATVSLQAFGVTAPVDVSFTAAGVLDPPDDPSRVAWWGASQLAGASAGATVVVGHVDGPSGPGALYRLVHARAGDRIVVAGADGRQLTYAVTSLSYHGKGDAFPASLFTSDGPARLVVISCGGTFDRSDDQYEDNVVVQAAPV